MRPRLLAASLVALSLFLAAGARADDGQDEVTLKNGGSIRGTVVSSEPGTSVKIIELGQKEVRVIPWAQVSDVERGKYAPKGATQPGPAGPGYGTPPPAPTAAAPEPKLGDVGVVRLHIDSPVPAKLIEQRSAMVGAYGGYGVVLQQFQSVCASPCDKVIDGSQGQSFQLTSEEFPAPRAFSVAGLKGDVQLHVEPGSNGRRIGGLWLTIGGGSLVLVGALTLPLASLGQQTGQGLKYAGIGMLAGGGASLVAGIVLLATSGTKIRLEERPRDKSGQLTPRYWQGEF
jgi:hypothetical protein